MKTKDNNVLFIHDKRHVGGGNTYTHGLVTALRVGGWRVDLIEGETSMNIAKRLLNFEGEIVVWSVYAEFPLVVYLLAIILGKKCMFIVYGIWSYESRAMYWKRVSLGESMERLVFDSVIHAQQLLFSLLATRIVHLSNYGKSLFLNAFSMKLLTRKTHVVIYGGVNKEIFRYVSDNKKVRQKLGMRENDIVLLMVGRIDNRKNYFEGVEILERLTKRRLKKPVVLYLILGSGSFGNDFSYMEPLFDKISVSGIGINIRIVTGVDSERLAMFYQAADAYLMLSTQLETFGLVTLEAMACGCPVFGYDACATSEVMGPKLRSFLVESSHQEELVIKISNYLNMPNEYKQRLSEKLISRASQLTWENSCSNMLLQEKKIDKSLL